MDDLEILVGSHAAVALRSGALPAQVLTPSLKARITAFNREGQPEEQPDRVESDLDKMRREVSGAIDRLEAAVKEILSSRAVEEQQARRWIMIVGIVLVALVIGSAIAPFVLPGGSSWVSTLMAGLSVTGLLYLLYSPVHKLIDIARERSGLIILPATFRIRVAAAASVQELALIAKELFDLLQKPIPGPDKP